MSSPEAMADKLTEAEYLDLLGASSAASWARACKRVKAAHGGGYPEDWHERVGPIMRALGVDGIESIEAPLEEDKRCTHHRAFDTDSQSWVCPEGCEPIPYKAAP